jgi:hypothetical protein
MKFRVTRTSVWSNETQPCPEAQADDYQHWTYWTLSPTKLADRYPLIDSATIEKAPAGSRSSKTQRGWFVDIATIDDLAAFLQRHGSVVIEYDRQETPTLEIYDNYRE